MAWSNNKIKTPPERWGFVTIYFRCGFDLVRFSPGQNKLEIMFYIDHKYFKLFQAEDTPKMAWRNNKNKTPPERWGFVFVFSGLGWQAEGLLGARHERPKAPKLDTPTITIWPELKTWSGLETWPGTQNLSQSTQKSQREGLKALR